MIRMEIWKWISRKERLPELTPVEIAGYEDDEAGSPWALDNGKCF